MRRDLHTDKSVVWVCGGGGGGGGGVCVCVCGGGGGGGYSMKLLYTLFTKVYYTYDATINSVYTFWLRDNLVNG